MANLMSEQVAEKLKQMIFSGEYPPGSKFPNEQTLIERFNVSRSTIREAIKLLQSNNILEIRRGVGTFVESTAGIAEDPFDLKLAVKDNASLRNLMEVRLIIEPGVARFACERATKDDIQHLRECCDKIVHLTSRYSAKASKKMIDVFANADIEFHNAIYLCAKNVLLERMLNVVKLSLTESYMRKGYRFYQAKYHTPNGHELITEAIKKRDADLAEKLLREHINFSISFLDWSEKKK